MTIPRFALALLVVVILAPLAVAAPQTAPGWRSWPRATASLLLR